MTNLQEKRQCKRYKLHRGSVACINGMQTYSTLTDISETGLAFICSPQLQHGENVEIALELKDGDKTKTFYVMVEVVRCFKDDFEHRIGAIVKTITHEFKTFLEQIKNSREKYGMAI
ncbi:MAG: PilZ domain-containing protein [Thiotrichales bacterium]|nr:PilZ domain-containing protein [Thiotrichales bacterium]